MKQDKELMLIAYANQYRNDGIEFTFFEPKKVLTKKDIDDFIKQNPQLTTEQKKKYKGLVGTTAMQETKVSKVIDQPMIERFFQRRWQNANPKHSQKTLINKELKKIQSFGECLINEYSYQIHPMIKYLKELKNTY